MKTSKPARCTICHTATVAITGTPYCFTCWPGGPVVPPPCWRCGSTVEYFTGGLCARCHQKGTPPVDSCLDCYAWGATRTWGWRCRACVSWRKSHLVVAACTTCGHEVALADDGSCRLCHKQASLLRGKDEPLDLVGANSGGQQLFFAGLAHDAGHHQRRAPGLIHPSPGVGSRPTVSPGQLMLLQLPHDLRHRGRQYLHRSAERAAAAHLEPLLPELAARFGWSQGQRESTIYGLRILAGHVAGPDGAVRASDAVHLKDIDLPVWTVLEVLTAAGLLIEDRTPTVDSWFAQQIDGLPEQMREELTTWYEVMKNGSPTVPRRRPRKPGTFTAHLRWALPVLRTWAAAGHTSLREISREEVLDALPAAGNPRSTTGQGLKSIFRLLKARKVLFVDPTSRIKTGAHQARQPLPVDLDVLRAQLNSDNPAQALIVALTAFHGLRSGHLRRLQLTDIQDGRLSIDGRVIVLAAGVRERLATYLDHRHAKWPATLNPHLFITYRTAGRGDMASARWILLHVRPLTPGAIREDRILNEAHATGGDMRALTDLFGLSINATGRYVATLDHPDLIASSRTDGPTHGERH